LRGHTTYLEIDASASRLFLPRGIAAKILPSVRKLHAVPAKEHQSNSDLPSAIVPR
jgi:hypothetical protein